jgi:hypothetical protein
MSVAFSRILGGSGGGGRLSEESAYGEDGRDTGSGFM